MSRCRGCGREILWTKTDNGKNMPVDPEPAGNGTFALLRVAGELRARHYKVAMQHVSEVDGPPDLYVSHWATCPQAKDFRK